MPDGRNKLQVMDSESVEMFIRLNDQSHTAGTKGCRNMCGNMPESV